jgi:hypothetical protein
LLDLCVASRRAGADRKEKTRRKLSAELLHDHSVTNIGKKHMSKGQDSKKSSKKEPAKTMKEKKAAKREKKEGIKSQGLQKI